MRSRGNEQERILNRIRHSAQNAKWERNISVLQIRRGNRDSLWIIGHILHKTYAVTSHMFSLRNKKKISLNYPQYPSYLELWIDT